MNNGPEPAFHVDLTNCDQEPIHLLGTIQDHGYLLALSPDWLTCFASANIAELLGRTPDDIIGRPLAEIFSAEKVHDLRNGLQYFHAQQSVQHLADFIDGHGGGRFDAALHTSGAYIVIEFEPAADSEQDRKAGDMARMAISRLQPVKEVGKLFDQAVRYVQMITGYDRVMAYRFLDDGAGEVVSEARRAGMEPFLGLRYPASDIPSQARALYIKNPIRYIADVGSAPVPLVPPRGPSGEILDLSLSPLRSVSPIHIEYLTNMGVGSSMSISIIRDGRLWGLFACHHNGPKRLSGALRNAADLFGQMFSLTLENKERTEALRDEARIEQLHARLLSTIADQGSEIEQLRGLAPEFRKLIACDGLAICVGGGIVLAGRTPTEEEMLGVLRFLNRTGVGSVFHTYALGKIYEPAEEFVSRAAGLLAIPISRSPRDYLVFFRQEIARSIQWAGNPEKPAEVGPNGIRLTPRKSFEAYREIVSGQSEPWTSGEIRLAAALRTTLLEVVLKLNDAVSRERKQSLERQELLISELNHRVRNLLGLVRGLISHGKGSAVTTEDFVDVLDHRIQALARAHDQITQQNWSPGSVRQLIEREGEAFLLDNADRVRISGEDVFLQPIALSTLALVIHELMTNSAKYGALCDRAGALEIGLSRDPVGQLVIDWLERGGPPVTTPARRGFGSTIIERSIPFDLKGEAAVHYELSGLAGALQDPGDLCGDRYRTSGLRPFDLQCGASGGRPRRDRTAPGAGSARRGQHHHRHGCRADPARYRRQVGGHGIERRRRACRDRPGCAHAGDPRRQSG